MTTTIRSAQIRDGTIVDADVAEANKDGTTVTPSLRTLGAGGQQACAGNDSRLSNARPPTGSAGGDLAGSYPDPTVTQARGLRETAGGATLAMGAVADGEFLKRSGSTVIGGTPTAADPSNFTTIVASANQDVTNAQNQNHSEFTFNVTANQAYLVDMDLVVSGSNATGDYQFTFAVGAGTMNGRGQCQSVSSSDAVQHSIIVAATAAATTSITIGTAADLNFPIAARLSFAFVPSNTTTFTFRFGNASASSGRVSRTIKGSIMRHKQMT
jgi:hypothetical protein